MGRTSSAVKNDYNAKAYDQIPVRASKDSKADAEATAKAQGESVNGLINNFLWNAIGLLNGMLS